MAPSTIHPAKVAKGRNDDTLVGSVATPVIALDSSDQSTLKYAHIWDVVLPPPSDSLKGSKFVPSAIRKHGRLRKLSVEVHRLEGNSRRRSNSPLSESVAGTLRTACAALSGDTERSVEPVQAEKCIVRIMKPPKKKTKHRRLHKLDFGDYDDDYSVSSIQGHEVRDPTLGPLDSGFEAARIPEFDIDEAHGGGSNVLPDLDVWTTKYELRLNCLNIKKKLEGETVDIAIKTKSAQQDRKVIFESDSEASAFCHLITILKRAQSTRDSAVLGVALGSIKFNEEELEKRVDLLIEIVSCWNLPAVDVKTSDPYVVVRIGASEIHRTKYISNTLNPIYTIKTNSMFILSLPVKKFFAIPDGLIFEVKDFDAIRGHDSIGAVIVPPRTLYECNGERLGFKLRPLLGEKLYGKGEIAIRCRHATQHDKEVMEALKCGRGLHVDSDGLDARGVRGGFKAIATRNTKGKTGIFEGEVKYRVMPGPDPRRRESTKWMTDRQIQEESMKESRNWLDAGSGKLATIFLEVIGCDNLPNLDRLGHLGNKTDAFVMIVYEDTVVRTDVIADCLSPRWLPWSQRAFIFHTMHSSSQIFLGIADYDSGVDDHDLVGRVTVDLSTLQPATEYFLRYNIYNSDDLCTRKPRGSISIRIMIQVEEEMQLVLSSLTLPPLVHVNVSKRKDFRVVRYACTGKQGKEKYGRKQVNAYIQELLAYKLVFYYAREGFVNVLFWRGHVPVSISVPRCMQTEKKDTLKERYPEEVNFDLPLNSMAAFVAGVCIVEKPHLFPSFAFALLGWILTSVLAFRQKHPSPWVRCKPFGEFVRMLALNTTAEAHSIAADENKEESEAFVEEWESRIKESEEKARSTQEKQQKELEEHRKELEEIGDIDISTEVGGLSVNPLHALWVPLQDGLEKVVHSVRFVRAILLWEECYLAFWVCAFSYLLAAVFLIVPWTFLLRWALRIVTWGLLGPWMKLVDLYWDSNMKPLLKRMNENSLSQKRKSIVTYARVEKENAAKVKAFKKEMFGKYITIVPLLKFASKYRDTPLSDSTARPVSESNLNIKEAAKNRTRVVGQQLVGDMIPILQTDDDAVPSNEIKPQSSFSPTASKDKECSEIDSLLSGTRK